MTENLETTLEHNKSDVVLPTSLVNKVVSLLSGLSNIFILHWTYV